MMTRHTTAPVSADADADPSHRPPAPGTVDPQDSLYRTLVQEVEDCAIFMLGLDGRVRTWNAGAQRIKGYSAADIIGQHFSASSIRRRTSRADWPFYELREARHRRPAASRTKAGACARTARASGPMS